MKSSAALLGAIVFAMDIGASQAAGACHGSKIWGACSSNADYSICHNDVLCQAQVNSTADFTCYKLQVPCDYDENNLLDKALSIYKYPIVKRIYYVPSDQISRYMGY